MLSLRLNKDLERRLDELAKKTGRTKSFYARQAIEEKLTDIEGYYLTSRKANPEDAAFNRWADRRIRHSIKAGERPVRVAWDDLATL